jgi:hypothetical protein
MASRNKSLVLVGLCLLLTSGYALCALNCPPNAQTCIKVDYVDKDNDGVNDNAVIYDGNGGLGIGWAYSDDCAFIGYGQTAYPNNLPDDPVTKSKVEVEFNPDCTGAGGVANGFPQSGTTVFVTGNVVNNETFFTCCCMTSK